MLILPRASSSAQFDEKAKAFLRVFFIENTEGKLFLLPKRSDGTDIRHQLLHSGKLMLQHINAKKNTPNMETAAVGDLCISLG